MIDRDGNAKIMDFGIARSLHTKGITGTGVIIGTPEYMAPEQAEGRDVDHRTDIYALGAILFEMVTGRVPFEGETPLSIVLKHRSEPPADPQTLNAQVTDGLSRIILKCLEKSRERRYRTAAAALEDLAAVEKALPSPTQVTMRAKPITTREITVKFSLKKLLWPGLPLFAAFAAAVFVIITLADKAGTNQPAGRRDRGPTFRTGESGRPPSQATKAVPIPPAPASEGGAPTAAPTGDPSSKILRYLGPVFKDPAKFLNEKDAQELQKIIETVKTQYPKEAAAFARYFDSIQVRIEQAKKASEAGDVEASKRSYDRGESEMRKLLAQVSERDRAEKARLDLQETKTKSAAARRDRPNLLSWIALEKERDADDAFAKNDFSGARILYTLLARVHVLSLDITGENNALASLEGLAGGIRLEAEAARAPEKQAWLFERAKAEEDGARERIKDGLVPQAAEQYILAAFLYEKAKEVALESAQAGRD